MKWLISAFFTCLIILLQPLASYGESTDSFGWQDKILSDLLHESEQHELQYDRLSPPDSEESEQDSQRTKSLYDNENEITRYGVNFFKGQPIDETPTQMRVRGGFSKFSSKARAGIELIISW